MHDADKQTGTVGRFLGDRKGSFAVMAGVTMATMAMAAGFGINLAQSFQVKSSMRNALDAAVTSTARDLTTGKVAIKDARALVEAFLSANSDTKFTDEDAFVLDSVVVDETAKTLVATASAHVDLAFPLFTTKNPLVAVTSAAVYSDKTIEVAMVLDITGSMAGKKIADLRTAATNAVNTFLAGQDPKNPRVRVAIVPYSESVNTGLAAEHRPCRDEIHHRRTPQARRSEDRFGRRARRLRHRAQGLEAVHRRQPHLGHGQPRLPARLLPVGRADAADVQHRRTDHHDRQFQGKRLDRRPYRHPVGLVHAVAEVERRAGQIGAGRRPTRPRKSPNTQSS